MKMYFSEVEEFSKEFKKTVKKYKSLPKDLEVLKRVLPQISFADNKNFAILKQNNFCKIIKGRFFCRYLKRNSLRVIFAFNEKDEKIEFIEIYFKGNKENENRERIDKYWDSHLKK